MSTFSETGLGIVTPVERPIETAPRNPLNGVSNIALSVESQCSGTYLSLSPAPVSSLKSVTVTMLRLVQ